MRLKGAKNIDNAKCLLVDSAAFACRPPPAAKLKDRNDTVLQKYIRHLVFDCLNQDEATMLEIVKRIRRLPWPESEPFILKCLLKVRNVHKDFFARPHCIHYILCGTNHGRQNDYAHALSPWTCMLCCMCTWFSTC